MPRGFLAWQIVDWVWEASPIPPIPPSIFTLLLLSAHDHSSERLYLSALCSARCRRIFVVVVDIFAVVVSATTTSSILECAGTRMARRQHNFPSGKFCALSFAPDGCRAFSRLTFATTKSPSRVEDRPMCGIESRFANERRGIRVLGLCTPTGDRRFDTEAPGRPIAPGGPNCSIFASGHHLGPTARIPGLPSRVEDAGHLGKGRLLRKRAPILRSVAPGVLGQAASARSIAYNQHHQGRRVALFDVGGVGTDRCRGAGLARTRLRCVYSHHVIDHGEADRLPRHQERASLGLGEGSASFGNFHLAFLVVVVPYVVKSLIPLTTVVYWALMSAYGGRKNEKVILPGKDLEEYSTIDDAEVEKWYSGMQKSPMQVFTTRTLWASLMSKANMCDLFQGHSRASSRLAKLNPTFESLKYIICGFLREVIVHSQSWDEEQVWGIAPYVAKFLRASIHLLNLSLGLLGGYVFTGGLLGPRMTPLVSSSTPRRASAPAQQIRRQHLDLQASDSLPSIGRGWEIFVGGRLFRQEPQRRRNQCHSAETSPDSAQSASRRTATTRILSCDCCDYKSPELHQHRFPQNGFAHRCSYLRQVYDLLDDNGTFVFQVAGFRPSWQYSYLPHLGSLHDQVRPSSPVPTPRARSHQPSRVRRPASRSRTSIDVPGVHYSATLYRWYKNWLANKEKVLEKYGETWFRTWSYFLGSATIASRQGSASVFQLTLHKNLNAYHRINGVKNHASIHVKLDKEPSLIE
ncbi:hypothetical protein DFP72DRAFT_1132239 [Ephemerocybe angulata]|uniref:sphingolipid C(9)-methyltransferase n=1 Tax=Ephemerocybe angulata TaxID=980116 RepID=A0A8H6HTB4_9AGAR|nr:hypothetical protein DFP72DRAFT_1132239 [Tulosesus angulatus]